MRFMQLQLLLRRQRLEEVRHALRVHLRRQTALRDCNIVHSAYNMAARLALRRGPKRMAQAQSRHERFSRNVVLSHQSVIVKASTTGARGTH